MSARSSNRRQAEIAVIRPAQPRATSEAMRGATERRLPGAMEVPIEQVVADPGQPRKDWAHDDGERRLAELAGSIREFGIIQPLLVREEGTIADGRQQYVIIAGGRRHAAALRAGLTLVPVVIRGDEAARVRILQLLENLQRQSLSALDEARAYQELIDLEGLNPPGLAERLHVSAQHVRDRLRVLADQVLADAVERRQISNTAAREIMKLPDEEVQAFRTRVLAGERLQTNDVVAARARLAAAGIINPRRKVGRAAEGPATVPGDDPPVVETAAPGSEPAPGQTTFVPPDAHPEPGAGALSPGPPLPGPGAEQPEQTAFVPAREPVIGPAPAAPDAVTLPGELAEVAERVAAALDRTLWGEARQQVAEALAALTDEPARVAWWLLVDAGVRERLTQPGWKGRPSGDD